MKKKILTLLIALAVSVIMLSNSAIADFGNYDTYDGGSDWSSSDWGSDYDSDWDSSSSGGYYYDSDSDGDSEDDPLFTLIVVAVVVVIIILVAKGGKGSASKANSTVRAPMRGSYADRTAEIEKTIRESDPAFTSGKFISFVKECYVKLQSAWSARDIEAIRLIQSEELYSQSKSQIEEYVRLGRINVMERVAVNNVYFTDRRIDDEKEYIDVLLNATQKDYIIDEKSGAVLEGSKEVYRNVNYIVTFMRSAGEKTADGDGINAANCPNCGAPLEITASGKCAYCDSVISSDSHTWVISAMRRA